MFFTDNDLSRYKFLVTGGAGFIGSNIGNEFNSYSNF